MKRFLISFICLVMVLSCFVCYSEGIDLESMSDFELIELQLKVQEAIYQYDPTSGFAIYPGVYIVGEDIEAGDYIVKVLEYRDENQPTVSQITVWPDRDSYNEFRTADIFQSARFDKKNDPVIQLNIKDGMVLSVHYSVYQFLKRK